MKKTKAGDFHAPERPPSYDQPHSKQREFNLAHRYAKAFGVLMILIYLALAIYMINS